MPKQSISASASPAVIAEPIPRAAVLATWWNAWMAGLAPADDLLDAMAVFGTHSVTLPGAESVPLLIGLTELLPRSAGSPVRVALPHPGDVSSLPGPPAFNKAAVEAGQAVVPLDGGLGLIPTVREGLTTWAALPIDVERAALAPMGPEEAASTVRQALLTATAALSDMDLQGSAETAAKALKALNEVLSTIRFPKSMPGSQIHTAHTSARVLGITSIAAAADGDQLTSSHSDHRRQVIRELERIARHSLAAACSSR